MPSSERQQPRPGTRRERDLLGERELPADVLYGVHTLRALESFELEGRPAAPELIHAYGEVKAAALSTLRALGALGEERARADAIEAAARELAEGLLDEHVLVDALAGGAGTALHMNVNEVIANRALVLLGEPPGRGELISPLDDVNRWQSTNDTFPTAIRLAAIRRVRTLEDALVDLQKTLQELEQRFAGVVKIGRTQLMDAVPTTLGRSVSAWAEAIGRDRWRLYKAEERLRVVNLGGTAIGTAITAPRRYVFRVVDTLRERTGIGFSRAENLVDGTQNHDALVEVSGIAKALATNLLKIAGDLRLLGSGPDAGLGEVLLPARLAGSSIMPSKVNPVIPEMVTQGCLRAIAHDAELTQACAMGSLELNPFLPLAGDALLSELRLLERATRALDQLCLQGLSANEARTRAQVEGSVATLTALVPAIGHERAVALAAEAALSGRPIRELVVDSGLLDAARFDELTSPEALCRLGIPDEDAGLGESR